MEKVFLTIVSILVNCLVVFIMECKYSVASQRKQQKSKALKNASQHLVEISQLQSKKKYIAKILVMCCDCEPEFLASIDQSEHSISLRVIMYISFHKQQVTTHIAIKIICSLLHFFYMNRECTFF